MSHLYSDRLQQPQNSGKLSRQHPTPQIGSRVDAGASLAYIQLLVEGFSINGNSTNAVQDMTL